MAYSSTVASDQSLSEAPLEREKPAGKSGVILPWPKKPASLSEDAFDEMLRKEDMPHDLSPQVSSAGSPLLQDLPQIQYKPLEQKRSLREELPDAVRAYDLVHAAIREHYPTLAQRKTLEIAPLERAVTSLVSSLERNSDALLYLAHIRQPSVYIYSHAINVSIYSAAYALEHGKSFSEAVATGLAGMLHDAGMTLLPLALLRSSQQLSATEQVLVKRHPIIAHQVFSGMSNIPGEILSAVLEHHERYDGTGYPSGMSGSRISFIGHIMAIASAFDAMTSPRRHKAPISAHVALGEMYKRKEKQFHPGILEGFIHMMGIYPVGSAVTLEDGYCGVVSGRTGSPSRPSITLIRDPQGNTMEPMELDMSKEPVAKIVRGAFHCSTDWIGANF